MKRELFVIMTHILDTEFMKNTLSTSASQRSIPNTVFRSFSNFRALRRALCYLSASIGKVPRIFAVFTDTTSRTTNFEPTLWNHPSLRVPSLLEPGPDQFRPIFTFSSVDIYSRQRISENTVTIPKSSLKRQAQIYLMRRKAKVTE